MILWPWKQLIKGHKQQEITENDADASADIPEFDGPTYISQIIESNLALTPELVTRLNEIIDLDDEEEEIRELESMLAVLSDLPTCGKSGC